MPKYILVAMNGPTPGEGDMETYNRWYEEVHIPDLLSVEGITSARRFEVVRGKVPGAPDLWPYVALYEIETDDLAKISKGMQTQCRPFDPTFDRSNSAHLFCLQVSEG